MTNKPSVTIFTCDLARKLLKRGYRIIDIKPDKKDVDGKRTLYIFENQEGLEEFVYTATH